MGRHFKVKTNHDSFKYILEQRLSSKEKQKWVTKILEQRLSSKEKIKEPWAAVNEEQTAKSEMVKAPSWLPSIPPYVQENTQQKEEYLKVMKEEDI